MGIFTDGFNKNIKDKSPEWMNDFFKKPIKEKKVVKINNLYDVSNKPKTCSICGKILKNNEINICTNCLKLKNK